MEVILHNKEKISEIPKGSEPNSKVLIIPPKPSELNSSVNLSVLDDNMKSLVEIVEELKAAYDVASTKSSDRVSKLEKVAGNIKGLIGTVGQLVNSSQQRREDEEDMEVQAGQLIEAMGELKQTFSTMEEKFATLNRGSGDAFVKNDDPKTSQ